MCVGDTVYWYCLGGVAAASPTLLALVVAAVGTTARQRLTHGVHVVLFQNPAEVTEREECRRLVPCFLRWWRVAGSAEDART